MPDATSSPHPRLDSALDSLAAKRGRSGRIGLQTALELLDRSQRDFAQVIDEWVFRSLRAKGIQAGTPVEAEEWLAGPFCVLRNVRLLKSAYSRRAGGSDRVRAARGRRGPVQVLPGDCYDRGLFFGFKAEVRRARGASSSQSRWPDFGKGEIELVLSAGNVSSIGPMDVLYKIFVEGRSVILNTHPVNDYLAPLLREGFKSLIEEGLLEIVTGGAEEGEYLCAHPRISGIHITGSDATHDSIVFGSGEEGKRRKALGTPILTKPISSELGNVSPVVVLPGPWRRRDLQFQAANLCTMLVNNAGFNCNAARVVIQHQEWPLREDLLAAMRHLLTRTPTRRAYYPGAHERHSQFVQAHPEAEFLGNPREGDLPWTLIADVPPGLEDSPVFRREAFCGLFAETAISADSPIRFLEKAVDFVNHRLWGTLNAALLIHPATLRANGMPEALSRAIDNLRYGTVAINHWPAVSYGLASTSWGAYPGHPLDDIQSGRGVVHNAFLISGVEKAVLRGPFRVAPTPPWFANNPHALDVAKSLTRFEVDPGLGKLAGVAARALFGVGG